MSERNKLKNIIFFFLVSREWRQQFVVTEAFKQVELKIRNKVLYFNK